LGLVTTIALNQASGQRGPVTLAQNYPNPVQLNRQDAHTIIQYNLNAPQTIRLSLYDILGRRIAILDEGFRGSGTQRVYFDASHLPSGVYLYRLETPSGSQTRRLFVIE